VSHGCAKELEGELAVEAPMADRDDQPALSITGNFYSRSAPRLARRSKSSALLLSTATCLGLHACRRRATDHGKARGGTGEQHTSLEGWRGGEPVALTSRRWGTSPHGHRGRRGTLRAAHGAAKPAGSPARRRRSRVQPSCFSASQRYFDCTYLQQIELCDKNVRYESCR
jgi:hypothetical protein